MPNPTPPDSRLVLQLRDPSSWLAPVLFLALCAACAGFILVLDDGHFSYSTDDAYIHLAWRRTSRGVTTA